MDHDWKLQTQVVPRESGRARQAQRLRRLEGEWDWAAGKLIAEAGDRNRTIVLAPGGHDPVRVELEVSLARGPLGRIGDISILLNTVAASDYWERGYALTTASYWDHCTTFYRNGRALARTEHSPAEPGRRHHVEVAYDGGHLRYWFDGRIILEAWDPEPLPMTGDRWIALRTWNTRMTVHSAKIYRTDTDDAAMDTRPGRSAGPRQANDMPQRSRRDVE